MTTSDRSPITLLGTPGDAVLGKLCRDTGLLHYDVTITASTSPDAKIVTVPTFLGPAAAARRALFALAATGWADLPDMTIESVVALTAAPKAPRP